MERFNKSGGKTLQNKLFLKTKRKRVKAKKLETRTNLF